MKISKIDYYLFCLKFNFIDRGPSEVRISVTRKKLPNVYKSCPKMISQEKLMTLTHLQKLPKNVRDLDKLIVSKGFKK